MSQFEFTAEHNKTISLTNNALLAMGALIAASGLFVIIRGFIQSTVLISLVEGVLEILIGVMFIRPKDNFQAIVNTEGQDISQLMTALRELSQAGIALIVLLVILIGVTIVEGVF